VQEQATGSPAVIELPTSGGEGSLSSTELGVTLIREEVPKIKPRPRPKKRLPPSVVPSPSVEPVVEAPTVVEELPPPDPELPITLDYFPEDRLTPWGEQVPDVLADPNPEAQAPEATAAWGEEEMVEFDGTPDERTRLSTRKDPLGIWFVPLYDQIARRWSYPMDLQALDISGRVELLVHYDRQGRLGLIQVRQATYPPLVDSARDAIPEKVDPLPKDPAYKNGMDLRFVFVYNKQ
jgi:outer membrane biosynthesis protein TonB